MAPRRRLMPKTHVDAAETSEAQSPASSMSSLSAPNYATTSGTRMNTHILLALSFLALGATSTNAQPLDATAAAARVGQGTGLSDQFSEAFLRFIGGSTGRANGHTLVLTRPDTPDLEDKQELVLNRPATPNLEKDAPVSPSTSRFHIPALPKLLFGKDSELHMPHLPDFHLPEIDIQEAALAMGIVKVLEDMRGVFVAVAQEEATEIVEQVLRIENGEQAEEFLLESEGGNSEPAPELDSSVLDKETSVITTDPEDLAIPGAFEPQTAATASSSNSKPEQQFELMGVQVDPYAALALSATLASLVVVLVIVGRYLLLQARERKAQEEDLEACGVEDAKLLDEEEVNEKVGLLDARNSNILAEGNVEDRDEKQDEEVRKAKEALVLLVEVANAAAPSSSSGIPPLGYSNQPITPTPLYAALKELSSTPFRPESPAPRPDPNSETPLRDAVEKLRSSAGTPSPGRRSLCVPRPSYRQYHGSEGETDDSDEEKSRVWRSANASPIPPPASSDSDDEEDHQDEEFVDASAEAPDPELAIIVPDPSNEVKNNKMALPSAELTHAVLDLALQLPGTEWIFQFLVIFVSWFGMFLGPTGRRRY